VNKKKYEPLAKPLRKKRWNKKDIERVKRLLAERKSKARSDSKDRQETIKRLWGLKEKDFGAKTYEERKLNEQKLKEQKFKKLVISVRELAQDNDLIDVVRELREVAHLKDRVLSWPELCSLVGELVELALLQDREIEYLTQFRRELERFQAHCPEQLKDLRRATTHAEVMQIKFPEPTPKRRYELKRGDYKWCGGVGLIEYEFGGMGEAEWRKSSLCSGLGSAYQPICLDDLFAGGAVHMDNSEREAVFLGQGRHRILEPGLQLLFGMHRNRFPKNLPRYDNRRNRRERLYDYRAVKEIMDALLTNGPSQNTKPRGRGAPKNVWPNPARRICVLSGIEARIKSLSVPEQIEPQIKAEFLAVVRRHMPDSAKK